MTSILSVRRHEVATALANPRVLPTQAKPAVSPHLNEAASERWLFGGGDLCLAGVMNGLLLERFFPFPDWADNSNNDANYLTTPKRPTSIDGIASAELPGGLYLPFIEAANQSVVIAFQPKTGLSGVNLIFGTLNFPIVDGGALYQNADVITTQFRGWSPVARTIALPGGYVAGQFIVLGIALSATTLLLSILGGANASYTHGTSRTVSTRKWTVGNGYYAGAGTEDYKVAGLDFFNAATLNLADLNAAAAKLRLGLLARNVDVFG